MSRQLDSVRKGLGSVSRKIDTTAADLSQRIDATAADLKNHAKVLHEALVSEIKKIAEGHAGLDAALTTHKSEDTAEHQRIERDSELRDKALAARIARMEPRTQG
jgi:hypothetical protein